MVKNISITEDVYNMLLRNKLRSESFSKVLGRILSKKKSILDFAGAWKMEDREAENMKRRIKEFDEEFDENLRKRVRKYDLS